MADTVAQMRTDIYAVLTTLDAASNIGVTHDYARWALHLSDIITVLRDPTDGQVRSWMIEYNGFSPLGASFTSQVEGTAKSISVREHRWTVRGLLGLDDSAGSEKTFVTTVQTVANAIDADANLHNQERYWSDQPTSPVDAPTVELRSIGGILCHVAELTFLMRGVHVGGT